jgi:hypothetical protein
MAAIDDGFEKTPLCRRADRIIITRMITAVTDNTPCKTLAYVIFNSHFGWQWDWPAQISIALIVVDCVVKAGRTLMKIYARLAKMTTGCPANKLRIPSMERVEVR